MTRFIPLSRSTFAASAACLTGLAAAGPAAVPAVGVEESAMPTLRVPEAAATESVANLSPNLLPEMAPLALPTDPPPAVSRITAGPDASFWQGWKHKVEGGLNGSTGNTESLSVRAFIGATRISDTIETAVDAGYLYSTNEGKKSKSRGEGNIRNDWILKDTNWGFFASGKLEYDEFQRWQWRASGFAGPSYTFIKDDTTLLRGRAGFGGSYEFGRKAKEEFVPELDLGIDFTHKLTARQNIFASADYYPSLSHFPRYRATAKAGWEILVDPDVNMYLKIGIADRYNSSPGEGFKRNDFEYFLTIGWEF